mmetsp:Transcript_24630/g.41962  ORF Transcript_24630/g.41962 Transcript_24630/m.41962 type:complete len:328 (+) Transcript_24630:167-1150(+)
MASVGEVLKVALTGEGLLPPASKLHSASRALIIQGWGYFMIGVLLFAAPGVFNNLAMFPAPFTEEEAPCYRMIGFTAIGIGYFYIMASRTNNLFWAAATIFIRMTWVPVSSLTMALVFDLPLQLCVLLTTDPALAIWTYLAMKKDLKDPTLTMGKVLAIPFNGGGMIPARSTLSPTARALIMQGWAYFLTGTTIYFFPQVFNKMMMFPEPFSDAVTPLYRMIGLMVMAIGHFYLFVSKMDSMFWATATIFTRMTMTPFSCMTLYLVFGGAPQLCITFSILDPTLAYWTYLTLKDNITDAKTQISESISSLKDESSPLMPDEEGMQYN